MSVKTVFILLFWGLLVTLSGQEIPAWRTSLVRADELRLAGGIGAERAYRVAEGQAGLVDDGGAALAAIRTSIGSLYLGQGRYSEAEALLRQSLAIQKTNPHAGARDFALTLHNLAVACRDTARYQEAESLENQAIQTVELVRTTPSPELVGYLNSLGRLYLEEGRIAEAEQVFQRSRKICQEFSKPLERYLPEVLEGLAEISLLRGDPGAARLASLRALKEAERVFGPDHLEVGRALDQLGRSDFAVRRFREARSSWLRSLEIKERWLGQDHEDTVTILANLGDVARLERRYAEAGQLVERALHAAEKRGESVLLALALHRLALIRSAEKKYGEAEALFARSLSTTERVLGPTHPELASCLAHYAGTLSAAGKVQDAEQQYRRAIAVLEQSSGSTNGWLPDLLEEHGHVLRKLKRKREAKENEQRARILRASAPSGGPNTQTVDFSVLAPKR